VNLDILGIFRATGITRVDRWRRCQRIIAQQDGQTAHRGAMSQSGSQPSKVYSADVMRSRGVFLLAALKVEREKDHKLFRRQGTDTRAVLQS
jgi:hypothetical protein